MTTHHLPRFPQVAGSHDDLYFEIWVRRLFETHSRGVPLDRSATDQRDVWSVGSNGSLAPGLLVLALYARSPEAQATARAIEMATITHRSVNTMLAFGVLGPLVRKLLSGAAASDPREAFREAAERVHLPKITGHGMTATYRAHKGPGNIPKDECWRLHMDLEAEPMDLGALVALAESAKGKLVREGEVVEPSSDEERALADPSGDEAVVSQNGRIASSCYLENSLPALMFLGYKYGGSFEDAVLANVNVGGDNAARGALVGAVMGASGGFSGIPDRFVSGLKDRAAIEAEADAFVELAMAGGFLP